MLIKKRNLYIKYHIFIYKALTIVLIINKKLCFYFKNFKVSFYYSVNNSNSTSGKTCEEIVDKDIIYNKFI